MFLLFVPAQSSNDLATIHDKLAQALNLYREDHDSQALPDLSLDKPFLGMHFIVLGDFYQIP